MAVSNTIIVLLFTIVLCTQAMEQQFPRGRRGKRDFMAAMASLFNSTEERLAARLEAKMEGDTQEKLQRLESTVLELLSTRLESMITEILTSKMKASEEKVAELVEAKTNATEERLATLEASNTETQPSPAACKYQFLYQYEKEAPHSSADLQRVTKLESELTRLQEKMSALDKRLRDNDLSVGSLHNASVLAVEGALHSMKDLVTASEQKIRSTMQNATEILASIISDLEVRLLARAENNTAAINASIAGVEQTIKELTTHVSALEGREHSVRQLLAVSEQVRSTMQNATEILAYKMSDSEARLLANQETNVAEFNASIARMERTTKELVTRVSAVEEKVDNATSLHAEEMGKTRMRCEDMQKRIADLKNHTTEVNGPIRYIQTCQTYYEEGQRTSGVYRLQLQDGQEPMKVFCDMSKGAGWVVLQRRQDGSVDFYRNWTSYEDGFGDLLREFWLGNRNIHRLTSSGLTQLRVDLQAWDGGTAFASYSHFSVGNASSSYRLSVSGYSGTAGDSLANHNNQKFSTHDQDNDVHSGLHCARDHNKGAWWYKDCYNSNLNGQYGPRGSSGGQYIVWYHWLSSQSLQRTELKLK